VKLFHRKRSNNRLLKLYKVVTKAEAVDYGMKGLLDKLFGQFDVWDLDLNSFYVIGPYPREVWKIQSSFQSDISKKNYKNIHHLMISDSEKRMVLSFQNWAANIETEGMYASIVLELMFDENLVDQDALISMTDSLYDVFEFEYGYIFSQAKSKTISEGELRKGLLSYSEIQNPEYFKWTQNELSIKSGFIRSVYPVNFLSSVHLNKPELSEVIAEFGLLEEHSGYSVWKLDATELEKCLKRLASSALLVKNDEFNVTAL
jgi:hypothetical protein